MDGSTDLYEQMIIFPQFILVQSALASSCVIKAAFFPRYE